ncbi:hypothetical protein PAXRUDRAFT_16395 [Paxillus rubicundulus Ve08.2h10]|uniref:AAA+ ATPase domain-containing protein n=1 Tax=Paxillus rubicundulus Ve08.2h10 TaxID=930991 RepID=A0A0D0CV16_9AGAM|nr:hypothetical protein PAXRUDRAFT_16395 [Paxillus rubicundulus Ve08.2h10]
MQTRSSQNTVLGKRAHHAETQAAPASEASASSRSLLTPEITPKTKRARTSFPIPDGDSNKENVPPFHTESFVDAAPQGPSSARSPRRVSTETISPPCHRPRARRHASVSSVQGLLTTPASSMSVLVLSTPPPTPPVALLPIYTRARALLRVTCNGDSPIAGRTAERDIIAKFIASARERNCYGEPLKSSLFISGTPGTGKTALVNSVLAGFGHCDDLDVMSINCVGVHNVDALWEHLCENIESIRSAKSTGNSKAKGKRLLNQLLTSSERRCLVVLDELDHIANSRHALSAVFSLARKYSPTLRIIGIANTHTLTASPSMSSNEPADVLTLHFGAYTSSQLLQVLQARLSPLYEADSSPESQEQVKNFLPVGPLTLLSKKVASHTGDVRTLFEVLRGAIDLAVSSSTIALEENPLAVPVPPITPNYILSALKAYLPSTGTARCNPSASACASSSSSSEIVAKIRNLGLQPRLALLAIVLASKRIEAALSLSSISHSLNKTPTKRTSSSSKRGALELAQLYTYYATILDRSENGIFTPVSRSEFSDLIGVLETLGLVSPSVSCSVIASHSKSGRRGFSRSPSLGALGKGSAAAQDIKIDGSIRVDEVLRGLGLSTPTEDTDPREEEVRAIWINENKRISRDIKATMPSGQDQGQDHILEEAFEG